METINSSKQYILNRACEFPLDARDSEWLGTYFTEHLTKDDRDLFDGFGEFEHLVNEELDRGAELTH